MKNTGITEINELIQNIPENDTIQLDKNYFKNDSNLIIFSKILYQK